MLSTYRPTAVFSLLAALLTVLAVATSATSAVAAPPQVATSIKPVQALVKMVMGSLGNPELIIPATTSPHLLTLKPSQAKMLEDADVVFWIGETLETALTGPLQKISGKARVVELLQAPGLNLIHFDAQETHTQDAHGHGNSDPHIWLSPSNARVLVSYIADIFSEIDPPNADVYAKNAKKARQRIAILIRKTAEFVAEMRTTPYLVQHDGFGYLAREFGFTQVGHIQTTPGREPGAKHVAEILALIKDKQVKCLFHEPQFAPKLAKRLNQETHVALREIDSMGIYLSLSETTYVRIIQGIITSMETCLYSRKSPSTIQPQ